MSSPLNVLITGAGGQLGQALQISVPESVNVLALNRQQFDLRDSAALEAGISRFKPQLIINTAAYTAVDQAEAEPEAAFAVNSEGPRQLASLTARNGLYLVHLSTDFVFDGNQGSPYRPESSAKPLGRYGQSKLSGETAIQSLNPKHSLILRTSWLYAAGRKNFVTTICRLLQEKNELSVVADQVGTPTWARGLAQAVWDMIAKEFKGIYHWSDAGVASWYDFAVAIQEEALAMKMIAKKIPIHPVSSAQYLTPAKRPAYSVLDKSKTWEDLGYTAPHWRENLRRMLGEWKSGQSGLWQD